MAAPALAESRTACPACGQLIHPIAGRCKHCKVDLTRHRAGSANGTARPRLVALGGDGLAAPTVVVERGPAGVGPAPAVAPPAAVYLDGGGTTADPRDRERASGGGWSRRWPIVVAAIAVLAILVSLAFLVFDLGGGTTKKKGPLKALGPSIEMTPTDPIPSRPDTAPVPTPPGAPTPTPPPADPDLDDPQIRDPFAQRTPTPPTTTGSVRDLDQFIEAAIDTGCRRLTQCGSNNPMIAAQCTMARNMLGQMKDMAKSMCPAFDPSAAQQCLGQIAQLPCTDDPDPAAMAQTLLGLQGCVTVCGAGAFSGLGLDPDDPLTP